MVGYLQLIETKTDETNWTWEFHLDQFRGLDRTPKYTPDRQDSRKHSYVKTVGSLLLLLSFMSCGLYVFFVIQAAKVNNLEWRWNGYETLIFLISRNLVFLISLAATVIVSIRLVAVTAALFRKVQLVGHPKSVGAGSG